MTDLDTDPPRIAVLSTVRGRSGNSGHRRPELRLYVTSGDPARAVRGSADNVVLASIGPNRADAGRLNTRSADNKTGRASAGSEFFFDLAAPVNCKVGDQPWKGVMGESRTQSSFGRLFELHRALEEAVSVAAQHGLELRPAEIVDRLLARDPPPGVTPGEMHEALLQSATRAGVRVRSD